MSNHTFDSASNAFNDGDTDGYNGFEPQSRYATDPNYLAGFAAGVARFETEAHEYREAHEGYDYAYEAEMDFYDYEPSPYDGTYSEM